MIINSAPFHRRNAATPGGRSRKLAPVALAVALAAALAFRHGRAGRTGGGCRQSDSGSDSGSGAGADISTSISYQQALEHANDPNTFVPGDAVTVPYRPRAGDATKSTRLPVPLPGATRPVGPMVASPQGSVWASPDQRHPIRRRRPARAAPSCRRRCRLRDRPPPRPMCCDARSTASCPTGNRRGAPSSTTTSSPPSP